jgi:hypothetical protein
MNYLMICAYRYNFMSTICSKKIQKIISFFYSLPLYHMKKLLSLAIGVISLTVTTFTYAADQYTDRSTWSSTKPEQISGREITTQQVTVSVNVEAFWTQTATSPYTKVFRPYSINGQYAAYGARPSYKEFHFACAVPIQAFVAATPYNDGQTIPGYN